MSTTRLHQWKHEARKRRALALLEQGKRLPTVARVTGLSYATVWRLNEPIRQHRRAERDRLEEERASREAERRRQPQPAYVVCRCGRFMQVTKTSVTVEVDHFDNEPDRLWAAAVYTCPECRQEVITGFARLPIAEQGHPSYPQQREHLAPLYPGRNAQSANSHTGKFSIIRTGDAAS